MHSNTTHCLYTAVTGLLLTTGAHAFPMIALPANPITTWTPIADTGYSAPDKYTPAGNVSKFIGFTPPVILQTGTAPPQIAFKGQMDSTFLPVTTANDEGIWTNTDPKFWASPTPFVSRMVVQEGDLASAVQIGDSASKSMLVQALQTTFTGATLFTTNSTASPLVPNFSVYEGGSPIGLAGFGVAGFSNGARAVSDGQRIAAWASIGAPARTRYWDVFPPLIAVAHTLSPFGTWPSAPPAPNVLCSPAISEYGAVAHRARSGAPWFRQDYIEADPISPSGLFPAGIQVVRRNDLAVAGERFGVFHPNLMAIAGGPNVQPTVAWQMNNMYTDKFAGPNVLGVPILGSNSLWCWRLASTLTPYAEIARVGQAAPDIAPRTFKSFHSLHLVDDQTTWGDADVFYGVILDTNTYAIYTRHITTVALVTTLSVPQLIATDDPAGPVSQYVPAIYPGTWPIAKLFRWFSVDPRGNVLIKATLGGGVPAAQKQCLIAAMTATNHAMEMRTQSGPTFSLPTPTHGIQNIANFAITNPEQGPLGRGQAIAGPNIGVQVFFPGGNGIFIGQ